MKILIVSATPFEIAPLLAYLKEKFTEQENNTFIKDDTSIQFLITGVGLTATAFHLGQQLVYQTYDLVINLGIAGAFNRNLALGDVVHVVSDSFGDLGVQESDGKFTSIFDLGLTNKSNYPYIDGRLENPDANPFDFLPKVHGLSVNKVHGEAKSIAAIQNKYQADVESMEGAAFFYACLLSKVSFLAIRSISNYVEPRNKANWKIALAIDNLNEVAVNLILNLCVTTK